MVESVSGHVSDPYDSEVAEDLYAEDDFEKYDEIDEELDRSCSGNISEETVANSGRGNNIFALGTSGMANPRQTSIPFHPVSRSKVIRRTSGDHAPLAGSVGREGPSSEALRPSAFQRRPGPLKKAPSLTTATPSPVFPSSMIIPRQVPVEVVPVQEVPVQTYTAGGNVLTAAEDKEKKNKKKKKKKDKAHIRASTDDLGQDQGMEFMSPADESKEKPKKKKKDVSLAGDAGPQMSGKMADATLLDRATPPIGHLTPHIVPARAAVETEEPFPKSPTRPIAKEKRKKQKSNGNGLMSSVDSSLSNLSLTDSESNKPRLARKHLSQIDNRPFCNSPSIKPRGISNSPPLPTPVDASYSRRPGSRNGLSKSRDTLCEIPSVKAEVDLNMAMSMDMEDVLMSDCDLDEDTQDFAPVPRSKNARPVQEPSTTMGLTRARAIRDLILGKSKNFPNSWTSQGFFFHSNIDYGLVQNDGGPCGILAVIQAYILKFLMHSGCDTPDEALVEALATVVWNATTRSSDKQAFVCLPPSAGSMDAAQKVDLGSYRVFSFSNYLDVVHFFRSKLEVFKAPRGCGVILLMVSCILSKGGVLAVRSDMDIMDTSLIVEHGYCAQELVNLLLIGCAVSNVFDGVQVLGSAGAGADQSEIKGIPEQGQVGFLTYYEHFEYFQVGKFLKSPINPVWVICSESHYSVLFSKTAPLPSLSVFDLHYYDQLARQDTEINLTIDAEANLAKSVDGDNMGAPIEDTIRTKWPGASIDWNGSDRIL